jgi:phosphomannomutase
MVTASHLPRDRNGFKFFSTDSLSGFSKAQILALGVQAETCALEWFGHGILPPSSGEGAVMCSQHVNWMPDYADSLKQAILSKTAGSSAEHNQERPLTGLKIILNSGNGAGGFFQEVLKDLGADVSASMHLEPDGTFPNGIPNPEDSSMLQQTAAACEKAQADLGIMLDTDADRCGFVVPRTVTASGERGNYEALNRNRLIALLGVIFAREKPGCAVVTDSVTSEGLSMFLEDKLGLKHVRYLKGYANVINKAKELTESGTMNAELAIETSGHCAMRENAYLDDGTYTAVKIVSLLANEHAALSQQQKGLLDLIADMEELDEVSELRMTTKDGSLDTMREIFEVCASAIESQCYSAQLEEEGAWTIDKDNLEGVRVRLGNGQFFMLRKSLHDPIISLQIEARSKEEARSLIVGPLDQLMGSNASIENVLDMAALKSY